MNTLLLFLVTMISQNNTSFPQPEFIVKFYPEIVMPGDTLYVMLVVKNPHRESIYINDVHYCNDFRIDLKDTVNQQVPHSEKNLQSPNRLPPPVVQIGLNWAEIKPGDSYVFNTMAINILPIEDLNEPFWEKHLKNMESGDERFSFCLTFKGYFAGNRDGSGYNSQPIPFAFESPIIMKQRPEKEMALIQKWHNALIDYLESQEFLRFGVTGPIYDMPKNTVVMNEKFSHWYFVRYFNLYPNTSDVPATWQGWKKLEDSLTPSTMRDEIRLARIVIQYCDTEDAAVLKELKDWFNGMNEVQRTCMAKSIFDRLRDCSNNTSDLYFLFREVYRAIHKYDIAAKAEYETKFLNGLGLPE